ncbi:hypothetical protein ACI1VO_28105, partial [Escherichia coli]|uniref:hypothetical protein n=1 Tax=Escherichia coli TaxID=562 RepID=UPI00384D42D0
VRLLQKEDVCSGFPGDALSLLNAVIADQHWGPRELGQCLLQIVQAAPQLEQDVRYQRLNEYSRRRSV